MVLVRAVRSSRMSKSPACHLRHLARPRYVMIRLRRHLPLNHDKGLVCYSHSTILTRIGARCNRPRCAPCSGSTP